MKPVAPNLAPPTQQTTLQTEIDRLCSSAKATDVRVTVPAPPSEEALRASTPFPPRPPETEEPDTERTPHAAITTPAPPISRIVSTDGGDEERAEAQAVGAAIPGPPRLPRIAGT